MRNIKNVTCHITMMWVYVAYDYTYSTTQNCKIFIEDITLLLKQSHISHRQQRATKKPRKKKPFRPKQTDKLALS